MTRQGRPPKPLDPGASAAAKLGAELRAWRSKRDLTQVQLGELVGFAPQHVSEVERAKGSISDHFIRACDQALETGGALAELREAAVLERARQRAERETARCPRCSAERTTDQFSPLPCGGPDGDAGDGEDVDPTTRLGLIEASAVTALGVLGGLGATAVPARAGDVNPELPAHWAQLLNVLGVHFEMLGPRELRVIVRHQIDILASHREVARGETRTKIVREEARWADFAAWLCDEIDQSRAGDAWTTQASLIARELDVPDMVAYVRGRQSERASDVRRAVAYAEDALRVRGASAQTRAWCARQAAHAHARAGNADACERHLALAYERADDGDSPPLPWAGEFRMDQAGTLAVEARCWLALAPAKAIERYDDALRDWPPAEAIGGGVHRARLALACAKAGEPDRARAEARAALVIVRTTDSAIAKRELRQLGQALKAA